MFFTYFLFAVGMVHVVWFLWGIYKLVDKHCFRKPKDLLKRYAGEGKPTWALITGATGDIGLEFCRQLAQRGFNIAMVGRNRGKLDELNQKIGQEYKDVVTATYQFDFEREGS